MPIDAYPGTLSGEKYAGSPPQAHALDGPAQTGSLPLATDTRGTLPSTRYAGSQPQLHGFGTAHQGTYPIRDSKGTLPRGARFPQDRRRAFHGTLAIGSTGGGDTWEGIAFDPGGDVWRFDEPTRGSIFRHGTEGLREGTDSRFGTTAIGSVRSPEGIAFALAFDGRGHLWAAAGSYWREIGTLGLRAGTDSRLGTVEIGSTRVLAAASQAEAVAVAPEGKHWWSATETLMENPVLVGTRALRAGTDSRRGTVQIGSFVPEVVSRQLSAPRRVWTSGDNNLEKVGTTVLRAGTDSRIGTYRMGSTHQGVIDSPLGNDSDFDPFGRFWTGDGGAHILGTPIGRLSRHLNQDQTPPKNEQVQALHVSIVGSFAPSTTEPSGVFIRQRGRGTLARTTRPSGEVGGQSSRLEAWIDPQQGSYRVGTIGVNARFESWTESHHTR